MQPNWLTVTTRQNGFTDCAAFVISCPQETFMKPVLERKLHQIYEVVGFRSLGPYTLEIEFNDGISRKIDFEGVLEGELYGPLKDPTVFQQVKLDREGGNLVWPNDADFDPEILHDWPERTNVSQNWKPQNSGPNFQVNYFPNLQFSVFRAYK
jgi:hypothetical protein